MIEVESEFEPDFDKDGNEVRVGFYMTVSTIPRQRMCYCHHDFFELPPPIRTYNMQPKEVIVELINK